MRVGGYLSPCCNCSTMSGQVRRIGNSPCFIFTVLYYYSILEGEESSFQEAHDPLLQP